MTVEHFDVTPIVLFAYFTLVTLLFTYHLLSLLIFPILQLQTVSPEEPSCVFVYPYFLQSIPNLPLSFPPHQKLLFLFWVDPIFPSRCPSIHLNTRHGIVFSAQTVEFSQYLALGSCPHPNPIPVLPPPPTPPYPTTPNPALPTNPSKPHPLPLPTHPPFPAGSVVKSLA